MSVSILLGDCRSRIAELADASVDSVVCDPPYELGFMGKKWDSTGIANDPAMWAEVLRVLKPGGHLVAFSGTRTYHRMAVAIEDAGFEIRDQLAWVYGSGFPKSLDVSKAIDKIKDWSLVEKLATEIKRAREESGLSLKQIGEVTQEATGGQYGSWYHRGGHMFFETGRSLPSRPEWEQLRNVLPIKPEFARVYDEAEREVIGKGTSGATAIWSEGGMGDFDITAPATEAAQQWQGWGTALKPSWEPICLARKPLIGSVAQNVLTHGTGALNIDGCRIEGEPCKAHTATGLASEKFFTKGDAKLIDKQPHDLGRWPANLCHDGSEEVLAGFPDARSYGDYPASESTKRNGVTNFTGLQGPVYADSGSAARFFATFPIGEDEWEFAKNVHAAKSVESQCGSCGTPIAGGPAATLILGSNDAGSPAGRASIGICESCTPSLNHALSVANRENIATIPTIQNCSRSNGSATPVTASTTKADERARAAVGSAQASATRFLYCPKATTEERGEGNNHPTVKPISLMRWLCRLVTPKGGTILDPFSGSGSTLIAADAEQFNAIGCELSPEYAAIAEKRIRDAAGMFADVAIDRGTNGDTIRSAA